MLARTAVLIIAITLPVFACHGTDSGSNSTRSQSALEAKNSTPEDTDRVVLDRAKAAEIAGVQEPVRPNTDAFRVVELDTYPPGFDELEGLRVLDARFVDDGVLTLAADKTLRHHSRSGETVLDRHALGPLSVESGRVAYVAGMPPDLELRVATLETGAVETVAPHLRTTWSPALSPDGRQIAFAAVWKNSPHLFVRDETGTLHRIASDRVPSSPRAPRWIDSELHFEDEYGQTQVDLTERLTVSSEVAQ